MAVDLGRITINGVLAINCDTDPSTGIGLVAPIGSFASAADGSGFYYKSTVGNTGWILASGATSVNGTTILNFGSESDRVVNTITVLDNVFPEDYVRYINEENANLVK